MKTKIMQKAGGALSALGFGLKKHSPEILVAAGIVGVVTSAVLACRATTKATAVIDKAKHDIDTVHTAANDDNLKEEYDSTDKHKDLAIVYTRTGVELLKLYAPAIVLGAVSLVCVTASNHMLKKRCAAIAGAYATLDSTFNAYSKRVAEAVGEETEKDLRLGLREVEVEETSVDEVTGEVTTTTKTVKAAESAQGYSVIFDSDNDYWQNCGNYNTVFLNSRQCEANDKLRCNGFLFLNDVYDLLHCPRTQAGQVVGWRYKPHDNEQGDNYVEFDVRPLISKSTVNSPTAYVISFNVDGYILDDVPLERI